MTTPESRADDSVPAKNYAAVYVAAGWLRSALYDVLGGEIDKEHIKRLVEATATHQIEKVIGGKKDELTIDYNHYLTEKEKHAIGGAEWTEKADEEKQG